MVMMGQSRTTSPIFRVHVMFFIRTAFIVGAGILLVPTDAAQQAEFKKNVAAATGYAAAFCERNPGTCKKGGEYWEVFKKKAEIAGGMAFDAAKDRLIRAALAPAAEPAAQAGPAASQSGVAAQQAPRALEKPSQRPARSASGSLRPEDMTPAWRGARG